MKRQNIKDYVPDESNEKGFRYTGDYFVHEIEEKQKKKSAIIQIVSALAEMILILAAASVNCIGNRTVYVVIPLECTLLCAVYYIMGSYAYLKCGNRMEKNQYENAFVRPVQSVTVALIFDLFAICGELVVIFRKGSGEGYAEYLLFTLLIVLLIVNVIAWKWQRILFGMAQQEAVEKK